MTSSLWIITFQTIIFVDTVHYVLFRVPSNGYALTGGERTPGAVGVATPIRGAHDRVIGSIGVTRPEQRFEPGDDERLQVDLATAYAKQISEHLGPPARR